MFIIKLPLTSDYFSLRTDSIHKGYLHNATIIISKIQVPYLNSLLLEFKRLLDSLFRIYSLEGSAICTHLTLVLLLNLTLVLLYKLTFLELYYYLKLHLVLTLLRKPQLLALGPVTLMDLLYQVVVAVFMDKQVELL